MFAARFAAITAATIVSGAAIAALVVPNPFQAPSQKVKQHEMITSGAGHWTGTITMHIPGAPEPITSPCHETVNRLGDYWTVSEFSTSVQNEEFVGSTIMGFDVDKKKFVATWVDSMTTSITNMEGEFDSARNAIVLDYKSKDKATGIMKDSRMVIEQDGDSQTTRFYEVIDGEENLNMEIEMTRKKAVEASAPTTGEELGGDSPDDSSDDHSDDE